MTLARVKRDERRVMIIGVEYGDSRRRAVWDVEFNGQRYAAELAAPLLEQVEAIELAADAFAIERSRLGGMLCAQRDLSSSADLRDSNIYRLTNVRAVRGATVGVKARNFAVEKKRFFRIRLPLKLALKNMQCSSRLKTRKRRAPKTRAAHNDR